MMGFLAFLAMALFFSSLALAEDIRGGSVTVGVYADVFEFMEYDDVCAGDDPAPECIRECWVADAKGEPYVVPCEEAE